MSSTIATICGPSISYSAHVEIGITSYREVHLSIPGLRHSRSFHVKNLLTGGEESTEGKFTLEEHLDHLRLNGTLDQSAPLLVLGLRNNLVNLRAPVIVEGQPCAMEGEVAEDSLRAYYGIGMQHDVLTLDTAMGAGRTPAEWMEFFCAGIPIAWDDLDPEALLDLMLCETADHSQLYFLPRGKHPRASDATRSDWARLHATFKAHLRSSQTECARAMRQAVAESNPPLQRCDNYLHAAIGVREDGVVVALYAHGRLEDLGAAMRRRGCRRALCVENSGSAMPTLLPQGMAGPTIPLFRTPNFRPRGRAALVFELCSATFESIAAF